MLERKKMITRTCLICISSLIGISWSSATTLSDSGVDDPYVKSNTTGETVVTWTANAGDDLVIQAAYYDGVYWYNNETISDGGFNVNSSAQIDAAGNIVATWETLDINTLFRTISAAAKPSGEAWEAPQVLSTALISVNSAIAMNGSGQTIVGWVNQDDDTIEIVTSTSGASWSSISTISGSGGRKGNVQIGIDLSGNCFVIWEEFDNGSIMATQTISGFESGWSTPSNLSSGGVGTNPSLSVAFNGNALVTWIDIIDYSLSASKYLSGEWDLSPTILSNQLSYFNANRALQDAFIVSWQNLDTGANQIIRFVDGEWSEPFNLSVDIPTGTPALSGILSTSFAALPDLQDGQIKVIQFDLDGSPSLPEILSTGEFNTVPSMDSSYVNSVAAWVSYQSVDVFIQASVD